MTIVVPIPADLLPTPPTTADPASFDARMDATLLAQQAMVPQVNQLAQDTYANAQDASASATAASGSASAAATSASSALSSKNTAQAAETAAVQAFDDFDRRYLGAKASAPTLDNDGQALIAGALYFNTGPGGGMRAWTGLAWDAAYLPASGYQETLISGTNIKTVNGASILGSGNVSILGASSIGDSIYKPDATITVTDVNGAKWLRTGTWVPIDAQITAGLSAKSSYAESCLLPTTEGVASFNYAYRRSIENLGGELWAVGASTNVAYGSDGMTWTAVNLSSSAMLTCITWNGSGTYVVGASNGTALRTTTKGAAWSAAIATGLTGAINALAFGAGVFVAVGTLTAGNSIATSPDGLTWTLRANPVAQSLNNVVFSGGQFVAVGNAATVLTSPDGITWTSRTGTWLSSNLSLLACVAGRYVTGAFNNFRSSSDGITWAAVSPAITANSLASDGTRLVAWANTTLWSSTDGVNFTESIANFNNEAGYVQNVVVAPIGSKFIAASNTTWTLLRNDFAKHSQIFGSASAAGGQNLYARYA